MEIERNDAGLIKGCGHVFGHERLTPLGFGLAMIVVTWLVTIGNGQSLWYFLWSTSEDFNLLRILAWSAIVVVLFGAIAAMRFPSKLQRWRNETIDTDSLGELSVLLHEVKGQLSDLPPLPEKSLDDLSNAELESWAEAANNVLKDTERQRLITFASESN